MQLRTFIFSVYYDVIFLLNFLDCYLIDPESLTSHAWYCDLCTSCMNSNGTIDLKKSNKTNCCMCNQPQGLMYKYVDLPN